MNIIKIKVDFENREIEKEGVSLVSGDYNSTKLVFEFDKEYEGRKVFELSKPKETDETGEAVFVKEIVNNEVILVAYDENSKEVSIFSEEGKYPFEISLYGDNSKLTSVASYLKIKKESVRVGDEIVERYLPIFDEIINEANEVINKMNKMMENFDGGYGGNIEDVRVDGTSVVTNKIANIQLRQTIIDILVEYGLIQLEDLTEEQIQALNEMVCEIDENGELSITYDETVLDLDFQIQDGNLIINNNINATFSINQNGELEVNYE